MISIVLADDHTVLRKGLRMLLEAQSDMDVIGEAATGLEAIETVLKLQPDVALLDITMPGVSGVQAIDRIVAECPATKCIALTMHEDHSYVRSVMAAGGRGYVIKRSADIELLEAIRTVASGGVYVGAISGGAGSADAPVRVATKGDNSALGQLTPREREVFCCWPKATPTPRWRTNFRSASKP